MQKQIVRKSKRKRRKMESGDKLVGRTKRIIFVITIILLQLLMHTDKQKKLETHGYKKLQPST